MKITAFSFATVLVFVGFSTFVQAAPLEVGDDAPKVKTTDQDGKAVDLGKELEKGISLVYFYPKADTPGCTTGVQLA